MEVKNMSKIVSLKGEVRYKSIYGSTRKDGEKREYYRYMVKLENAVKDIEIISKINTDEKVVNLYLGMNEYKGNKNYYISFEKDS